MVLRSRRKAAAPLTLLCFAALLGTAGCQREDAASSERGLFGGNKAASANTTAPRAFRGNVGPTTPDPATPTPTPTPMPSAPGTSPTAPGPDGRNRQVRITNQSGQTITLIKGSPSSVSSWGRDRIPSGVLNAGSTVMVDFNDNNGECVYDLQATLMNGTERAQRAVNVCTVAEWVVTPSGSEAR